MFKISTVKKCIVLPVALAVLLLATGCHEGEFTNPSFLHIEGMDLVVPQQNAVSTDTGFYTSNIVAVYVVMKRPGIMHQDTIGLFELPFTTPILFNGEAEYIELAPAVPQSGRYDRLPYYTFYKRIRIEKPTFAVGDTLDLGVQHTTYDISLGDVHLFEPFEPTEGSVKFDSVMQWDSLAAPGEARSGKGYGYVHVPDSLQSVLFCCTRDFVVTDPGKVLYLELDTRNDIEYAVMMYTSRMSGANKDEYEVMRIYPTTQWKHIYVNLGATWREVGHNPEFQVHFQALNVGKEEGDIRLDNVKLITTSKSL